MGRWIGTILALLGGGVLGVLARVVLRMVYDTAASADRFDEGLFIIGTLLVTVSFLVAAAVSTPVAVGAAAASTGTIGLSWMGLRLVDVQPTTGGLGFLFDELRWTLSNGYADIGAVVLSAAFVAIAVERARRRRGSSERAFESVQ